MSDEPKEPDSDSKPESGNAAPEGPPVRVCPNCSAQSQTSDDTCPHCGASFIRNRRLRAKKRLGGLSNRKKIVIGGVVLGLLVGGVAVAVVAKVNHDNRVAREHKEEQEAHELAERKKAREEKAAEERQEADEALERIEANYARESVNELETAITKDANGEAEEGFGEYVSETSCEPQGGKVDPSLAAQDFSCLAVTSEEGDLREGYRYTATINYAKGSFTWRLGGP